MESSLQYEDTINKFKILELTEYEKVCFLDADILIHDKKIEDIFDFLKDDFAISYELREDVGEDEYLCGQWWLCRPNLTTYQNIINTIIQKEYETPNRSLDDEYILKKIQNIYPTNIFDNKYMAPLVWHLAGSIKSWERDLSFFPLFSYLFFEADVNDFITWLDCMAFDSFHEREFLKYYEQ